MSYLLQKPETRIQKANRLVPIIDVLGWVGVFVPEFSTKSRKARCPYADMYHLDADANKSMRVYSDTNTANCFSGCGTLNPVSIFAKMNDLSFNSAAQQLLDKIGYKPKTSAERWNEAVNFTAPLNREAYRDSLMEYCFCAAPQKWDILQYSDSVSGPMGKFLEVLNRAESENDAKMWLEAAKTSMSTIIREELNHGKVLDTY